MSRVTSRRAAVFFLFLVASISLISGFLGCQQKTQQTSESQSTETMMAQDPVARGKYLVTVASCQDCHSPKLMSAQGPQPDMTRMLSGHPRDEVMPPAPAPRDSSWVWGGNPGLTAFYGPWGVSFAANLTPDTTTGIGAWTAEQFIQTIRAGKHLGTGREILPPMPWQFIAQMTDEDLRAVFAYLKSIPAVSNEVPLPVPPKS